MFQSEMENLELGLNLGSSDLLFPDELFNVPLDQLQQAQQEQHLQQQDEDIKIALAESEQQDQEPDLLQKVIDEIKMAPFEIKVEQPPTTTTPSLNDDAEMKSILADYDDLLFEEPSQLLAQVAASPGGSSIAEEEPHDNTQNLIEEMEEFLSHHEKGDTVLNTEGIVRLQEETVASISDADTKQAEEIVEALVSGDLTLDDYSQEQQRQLAQESGYSANAIGATISNISEIVTEDGNTVVIVIANDETQQRSSPSPAAVSIAQVINPSPYSSTSASPAPMEDSDDSDWFPDSPAVSKKATTTTSKPSKSSSSSSLKGVSKRGPYKQRSSLSPKYNVKDKKERKKMQNVVAARRYRDKKKVEQVDVEQEENELSEKNDTLKDQLREMENEVKTLKKLMVELGLVKVSKATAASLSS